MCLVERELLHHYADLLLSPHHGMHGSLQMVTHSEVLACKAGMELDCAAVLGSLL